MRPQPEQYAKYLAEIAEEHIPQDWSTEQVADFWHKLTENCTLRLIRYKPELVHRWPPGEP